MPNTELAEQIKTMLEEVKGQLETKTEDGQVIKLLDVFKMFPALQEKYTSLEKRLEEFEQQAKSRKWATITTWDGLVTVYLKDRLKRLEPCP